ncbi:MAG: hypothetical protein WKF66_00010 [Pedobacter sp.]
MRTHSTITLRTLVLHDMNQEKHTMTVAEINNWVNIMPDITAEQLEHISFFVNSIFGKEIVKRQFKQMQSENTILLDAIDKYQNLGPELLRLKTVAIVSIMTVLDELMNWKAYSDKDMRLPAISVRKRLLTVENEVTSLNAQFIKLKVAPELQKAILEFPRSLIRLKTWSNDSSEYLKIYMSGIATTLEQCRDRTDDWLREWLININHNSESFTNYLKANMLKRLYEVEDIDEKLLFLNQHLGWLRNRSVTKKLPLFDKNKATIYDVMHSFLTSEISFVQSMILKARPPYVNYKNQAKSGSAPDHYKVAFNLSVESLAYLIKLMVNTGVIEDGIREQLFRYISGNFQTPGTVNSGISAESFKTKYKNVTQTTAIAVKASLMAMIKLIDKEF